MKLEFTVRQFQASDSEEVTVLWNKVLPASQPWNEPKTVICRKLNTGDGLFFVGEQNEKVIATVLAGYDGVRGWIYALAVDQEHQRGGVGRRMLEEAERTLLTKGCDKINLQVRAGNSEAVAFYERSGYAIEDRVSFGKPLNLETGTIADAVAIISVNGEVFLSQIDWDDKPAYLKHLNETDEFHARMGMMPFPYREIDADQWISKVVRESLETDRRRNWAIRNRSGDLIGGAGVFDLTMGEKAEIGYWLAKPFWGQGIVGEVVRRLCEFVFQAYDLHRIFARVFATNPASARVLEKSGFTQEGILRGHHYQNGRPIDVLFYGIARPC